MLLWWIFVSWKFKSSIVFTSVRYWRLKASLNFGEICIDHFLLSLNIIRFLIIILLFFLNYTQICKFDDWLAGYDILGSRVFVIFFLLGLIFLNPKLLILNNYFIIFLFNLLNFNILFLLFRFRPLRKLRNNKLVKIRAWIFLLILKIEWISGFYVLVCGFCWIIVHSK